MSHLFAYFSRMKFIRRWGLMRSTYPENVQEHSLRVAQVAHALALIRNRIYGGQVVELGFDPRDPLADILVAGGSLGNRAPDLEGTETISVLVQT